MAIDAGIYQNFLRPPKTVQEYDNEAMQAQDNALSLQAKRMQMGELQRKQAEDELLRNTARGFGADTSANYNALVRAGLLNQAQAYQKSNAEARDKIADADKKQSEIIDARLRQSASLLANVRTPEQYLAWHEGNHSDPVLGPLLASRGITVEQARANIMAELQKPGGFEQLVQKSALGLDAFYKKLQEDAKIAETGRHNLSTERTAQGQLGVAQGQLGVARERLKFDKDKQKDAQGGAGNASEDERKAAGWYSQATNAWNNMQAAMGGVDPKTGQFKNEDVARPGIADAIAAIPSFGIGEVVGNSMRTADRQKFIQASSSLSEALLRAATGAGVNRDEAQQKIRELTPVFGEDPETTKQKMKSIPMYLDSLKARAGRAMPKQQQSGGVVDFGSLK